MPKFYRPYIIQFERNLQYHYVSTPKKLTALIVALALSERDDIKRIKIQHEDEVIPFTRLEAH